MRYNIRQFIVLFLIATIFVIPVFWITRHLVLRLDTDYDYVIPTYTFLVDYIYTHHAIPLANPYIGSGIPILGDPLLPIFYPPIMVPILVFGVSWGIRISFFFHVIASGIAMWIFLTTLGMKGHARFWGTFMYEISGGLAARFAAGHMEKIFSYPLFPLFFALIFPQTLHRYHIMGAALVVTLLFFTGDMYALWYMAIFYVLIRGYYVVTRKSTLREEFFWAVYVFTLSFLFSLPKTIPMIFFVLPKFARFYMPDPYAGSIHAPLAILPFVVPFKVVFYDRPFFQRLFGFHYNWYEYYAFMSPLPFLFLLKLKSALPKRHIRLLLFLIIAGFLFAAAKYWYSPLYWVFRLFPDLGTFRVPQRIFLPLASLVIGLLAYLGHAWSKITSEKRRFFIYSIYLASFAWAFLANQRALFIPFEQKRIADETLVQTLRQKDSSSFYVASFVCCMQQYLVEAHIPIINYYYPWLTKDTPRFLDASGTRSDFSALRLVRPTYIIAPQTVSFFQYTYRPFLFYKDITVWKTDKPTIKPGML